MYVVDRMQMVTKFVVMCYIASAAIPLLNWVVLLVLTISIFIDETNLLRVLYPAPQSDEAVVKCILVFVMPLAVLIHLFAARVFFKELGINSELGGFSNHSAVSGLLEGHLENIDESLEQARVTVRVRVRVRVSTSRTSTRAWSRPSARSSSAP